MREERMGRDGGGACTPTPNVWPGSVKRLLDLASIQRSVSDRRRLWPVDRTEAFPIAQRLLLSASCADSPGALFCLYLHNTPSISIYKATSYFV